MSGVPVSAKAIEEVPTVKIKTKTVTQT